MALFRLGHYTASCLGTWVDVIMDIGVHRLLCDFLRSFYCKNKNRLTCSGTSEYAHIV